MDWDTVIGLEVHAQLKTDSKLFSGSATIFGAAANTQASFIDAGLPGVLPVLNEQALVLAVRFGLAISAKINTYSVFERKNYFYPDLPKGYQISQYEKPIISDGSLTIFTGTDEEKNIKIIRAHLEEDAGKSIHDTHQGYTGIDLNRAGNPLLEIVTDSCIYSAEEAIAYLKNLHELVRFLDICDGNMQEGSFRCDVNLSLKPKGSKQLGTRTELKNLNSFRFIEKAILYEQKRQKELLENGEQGIQQTRLFCPDKEITIAMREKETENDYRYFPDPDLLPIYISQEWLESIKNEMPERPQKIKNQLKKSNINEEDIQFILSSPSVYRFYSKVKKQSHANDKVIINWLKGQYVPLLKEKNQGFDHPPVSSQHTAQLLNEIHDQTIDHHTARKIFHRIWQGETNFEKIIKEEKELQRSDDNQIHDLIKDILATHPKQVTEFNNGKDKLLSFFVGQLMKATKGKINPKLAADKLKEALKSNNI